jgi:hypothetical protein
VHTSYFIGKDASKWHSDVPSYEKVGDRSVYDFVMAPQADPARITLAFEGGPKGWK